MRPILFLSLLVGLDAGAAAATEQEGAPTVLVFRSAENGRSIESYAVREGDALRAPPDALRALGLIVPADETRELMPLADIDGLSVRIDDAAGTATLTCATRCYETRVIGDEPLTAREPQRSDGAFLNVDLNYQAIEKSRDLAGAFELGVFGEWGEGEATWTAGAQGDDVVRLETRLTFDDVGRRVRVRVGDSVTRAAATGVPARFGGIQIARDFSLDPRFVTFPTPVWGGVATEPSVVDLYVNGVLRMRENVDSGPFSIADPPSVNGAGTVRIVVTDSLGREHAAWAPFYSSRALLKPGLVDYSVAAGALRERFSVESAAYGDAFASGVYRRGLTAKQTGELRAEATPEVAVAGAGLSSLLGEAAQGDIAIAFSQGKDADGLLTRAGLSRSGDIFTATAEVQYASTDFRQIGFAGDTPRLRSAMSLGFQNRYIGSVSLSATSADFRKGSDVRTIALNATPTMTSDYVIGFSATYVEADEGSLTVGARVSTFFGPGASSFAAQAKNGLWALDASMSHNAPAEGGLGWRAAARTGDMERRDVGLSFDTLHGLFGVEASRVDSNQGVRAAAAFGLAWIDGGLYAARPIRDSFALVDARAPNVRVTLDNRPAGVTGANGKTLVIGLRAFEENSLGIRVDDLPEGVPAIADEIALVPAARAGAIVRFPVEQGRAGEIQVLDEMRAPLAAGVILVRESDGARFPVGENGRVYVEGVHRALRLTRLGAESCAAIVTPETLTGEREVTCARTNG